MTGSGGDPSMPEPTGPDKALFTNNGKLDQPEILGARWWQARLEGGSLRRSIARRDRRNAETDRRGFLVLGGVVLGFLAIGGGAILLANRRDRRRTVTVDERSLEVQRQAGWNVDATSARIDFAGAQQVDAAGRLPDLDDLERALRPRRLDLHPFYVPTLFQSLQQGTLRAAVRPIATAATAEAEAKGRTLREIFGAGPAAAASDVAIVVDLDGPASIAFAAGLLPRFDAVFCFDNWPHPRGVVPSHLTLGAAVWQRSRFATAETPPVLSPCFVLDRQRLAPYANQPDRFDNRYVAKLPAAARLKSLGVRNVLYVAPNVGDDELDDLNETFLAWQADGIGVRKLALGDVAAFVPGEPPPAAPAPTTTVGTSYHGHPSVHWWFWRHYGFYGPVAPLGPVPAEPGSAAWRVRNRSTMFGRSTLASGAPSAPSGFGHTRHTTVRGGSDGGSSGGSSGGSWRRGTGGFGG